jgi:hypothetical protein
MRPYRETLRLVRTIERTIADGTLFQAGFFSRAELAAVVGESANALEALHEISQCRPAADWDESRGAVLWWTLPVAAAPYVGTPLDAHWPGGHTHWTPLPRPTI